MAVPTLEMLLLADITGKYRWRIAFHEAGHAAAEMAQRSFPDRVVINWDDDTDVPSENGDVSVGYTATMNVGFVLNTSRPEAGDRLAVKWDAMARRAGAVLAAGDLAFWMSLGTDPDVYEFVAEVLDDEDPRANSDAWSLQHLVEGLPRGHQEAWLEEVYTEAVRMLRAHWPLVQAMAAELYDKGELDRDRLFDLAEEHGLF